MKHTSQLSSRQIAVAVILGVCFLGLSAVAILRPTIVALWQLLPDSDCLEQAERQSQVIDDAIGGSVREAGLTITYGHSCENSPDPRGWVYVKTATAVERAKAIDVLSELGWSISASQPLEAISPGAAFRAHTDDAQPQFPYIVIEATEED